MASRLGNTPIICRMCYIHPEVITSYLEGALLISVCEEIESELRADLADLKPEEAAVLTFLRTRLNWDIEEAKRPSARRRSAEDGE